MILLYSGTPGSGKSFHATQKIYYLLRRKKNVICNYNVNLSVCAMNFFQYWLSRIGFLKPYIKGHKRLGKFEFKNNTELTPDYLIEYARKYHNRKKEGQTTVIIDECGIMFNPRTFAQEDRLKWIQFFSLHRHYGYDFILISQSDRMLDRQIRAFIEYDHRHRKANNFGFGGILISLFTMSTFFVDVKLWYGLREKVGADWIRYSRRIASLYDTMFLDSEDLVKDDQITDVPDEQGGASLRAGDTGGPAESGALPSPSPDQPDFVCTLLDDR